MSTLNFVQPDAVGLSSEQLQRAHDLLQKWCAADLIPAAALCVGRKGNVVEPRFFGQQRPEKDSPALRKDSLFLVASITKPVTVTAVMMLVERGELTLSDRVAKFVPRFAANGKGEIQVVHLITPPFGLPYMLPDNIKMLQAHRPMSAFIDAICELSPLYPPGTQVGYQSMGTAMLGEIVHQVLGKTIQEFVRREIFEPLDMKDTWL